MSVLILASGCTSAMHSSGKGAHDAETSSSTDDDATRPALARRDPPTCDAVAEGKPYCRTATVSGRVVRYALVPARGQARELMLVDRGGPGATLFGPTWPKDLIARLSQANPSADLLLLEEPWVAHRPSESCSQAMSTWQKALRGDSSSERASQELVERCGLDTDESLWGWTPSSYREAVESIEEVLGMSASRFVGASFAGTRISYLDRRWTSVSLVSPMPAGVGADELMTLRQGLLDRALRRCRVCTGGESTLVEGRSVPVTDFDRQAAMVATGYHAPAAAARFRRSVTRGTGPDQLLLVGRLSDSATGRIGVSDMSPAVLAIMSEQCRAFVDDDRSPLDDDAYFGRYFSPCGGLTAHTSSSAGDPAPPIDTRSLCVSVTRYDSVVPAQLSARLRTTGARTTIETYRGAHGSVRGLAECL